MIDDKFARLPVPKDGRDADMEEVARLVKTEAERIVSQMPTPRDGQDADPAEIKRAVAEAVTALPPATPGKDADLAMFDGDPFEYVTHCTGTIINGRIVSEVVR